MRAGLHLAEEEATTKNVHVSISVAGPQRKLGLCLVGFVQLFPVRRVVTFAWCGCSTSWSNNFWLCCARMSIFHHGSFGRRCHSVFLVVNLETKLKRSLNFQYLGKDKRHLTPKGRRCAEIEQFSWDVLSQQPPVCVCRKCVTLSSREDNAEAELTAESPDVLCSSGCSGTVLYKQQ